jgi:hypothetical protein
VRVLNRLLALLLALALIVAGLWGLVISVAHALGIGSRPDWLHTFDQALQQGLRTVSTLQLEDSRALAAASGLAVLGILLLLLELRPWPPLVVFLDEDDVARWWLDRAAFERVMRSAVSSETTSSGVRARLRGRRRWRLRVEATASPRVRPEIEHVVRSNLARLGHADDSYVRVRIRRRGRVA